MAKISISFLGTGAYKRTSYQFRNSTDAELHDTALIQVAVQQHLANHEGFGADDKHILLLTDTAKKRNYLGAAVPYNESNAHHSGLERELKDLNLPTPTRPVSVPAGHDHNSVTDTFDSIMNELREGDEIYLDITHGFRSLAMLGIVLGNFVKVAKNASIKAIYYGAFEELDKSTGVAPVYDLSYLIELQDWSMATYGYLNYGFIGPLKDLSHTQTKKLMRETRGQHQGARATQSLLEAATTLAWQVRTNRSNDLFHGQAAQAIRQHARAIVDSNHARGPLTTLVNKIAEKSDRLTPENQLNWLISARMAYNDGLVQQTCSLLQEGVVSYLCRNNGLSSGTEADRLLVVSVLNARGNRIAQEKLDTQQRPLDFVRLYQSPQVEELASPYVSLSHYRNDLMHAGTYTEEGNNNARDHKSITKAIEDALKKFEAILL